MDIVSECTTYAYLGPEGTNSQEALNLLGIPTESQVPYSTIPEVIQVVHRGICSYGIVPIENSQEGSVNATIDELAFNQDHQLCIVAELVVDINHHLIVSERTSFSEICEVISHPQAIGQCSGWLSKNLPNCRTRASSSTAEAVREALEVPGFAAIGSAVAAQKYGGKILRRNIEDFAGNKTRFVVIGESICAPTGNDKTSLALFLEEDKPGALLMILSEFAYAGINLTKIQSRPTKKQLGSYYFFVDVEGHIEDPSLSQAITCLKLKLRNVKILGSYPAVSLS